MDARSVSHSDRHNRLWLRVGMVAGIRTEEGAIIATITAVASGARLGEVRQTYARAESFPPVARAYTEVSQVVRETGLLKRAQWFYALVGTALVLSFGGAVTGFILLGDS